MPRAGLLPSALLIDADGTLWDTRVAMEAAGRAGVRAAWPDVNASVADAASRRYRGDPTGAFRRFVAGELTFEQMRLVRLQDAARAGGLAWSEPVVSAFAKAYQPAFDAALEAFPDTVPLLRWCASRAIPIRVLTNSAQDYTMAKVAATGLGGMLGEVCSRDCLGVGKPEAAVFHHACDRLGRDPHEVLYVGDEWTCDALGAADAGLASAWLVRGDGDPATEVVPTTERLDAAGARGIPVISSLAEVPELLGPAGFGSGQGVR